MTLVASLYKKQLLVEDFVELTGESNKFFCSYPVGDVQKVNKAAAKHGMLFAGLLHTHPESEPVPSNQDRISRLALMFVFDRPLLYYILSPESLRLATYSIPAKIFYQLKDSIKLKQFEMGE